MFVYSLTATGRKKSAELQLGPQPFEVFDTLEKSKNPVTVAEIADRIKNKIETVQTPERIARWYLTIFEQKGWVVRSVKSDKPVAKTGKPKPATTPKPAEPAAVEPAA